MLVNHQARLRPGDLMNPADSAFLWAHRISNTLSSGERLELAYQQRLNRRLRLVRSACAFQHFAYRTTDIYVFPERLARLIGVELQRFASLQITGTFRQEDHIFNMDLIQPATIAFTNSNLVTALGDRFDDTRLTEWLLPSLPPSSRS